MVLSIIKEAHCQSDLIHNFSREYYKTLLSLNFLYVFIGGGLGAMSRFGIARIMPPSTSGFPTPTLIANLLSCILLGMLMSWVLSKQLSHSVQLFLMTGFCGGFSTFSTFSAETFKLLQAGQAGIALLYVGLSLGVCLLGIALGMRLVG